MGDTSPWTEILSSELLMVHCLRGTTHVAGCSRCSPYHLIRDLQHLRHFMTRDNHRAPVGGQFPKRRRNDFGRGGADAPEWFVGQQTSRLAHHRHGNLGASALATRIRSRLHVQEIANLEEIQDLGRRAASYATAECVKVLPQRKVRGEESPLRQVE